MLTIRMQRRGRTGHAQFRVVVQDSRFSPTSGRVVAYVGSYNPHTKAATLDGEKISAYLATGAQPSDRVAKLLTKEGIKLPNWFSLSAPKKKEVRNPDKRRSTRPEDATAPSPTQTSSDEVSAGEPKAEDSPDTASEEVSAEADSEETAVEAPTEETSAPAEDAPAKETVAQEPEDQSTGAKSAEQEAVIEEKPAE